MNSFDLDAECRAACERARSRIVLAPIPVYAPRREDFAFPIWLMVGMLIAALFLLAWRMPAVIAIGAIV